MLIAFPDCLGISRWSQKFWETLGTRPHPKGAGTPNVPKGGKHAMAPRIIIPNFVVLDQTVWG